MEPRVVVLAHQVRRAPAAWTFVRFSRPASCDSGSTATLIGATRVEAQHHARLVLVRLLVVGVEQEDQRDAVGADRRLDHVGQ